jgi:SAM-dependent methyltransferase
VFGTIVAQAELELKSRILDVGCGTGTLLAWLSERVPARLWGVDASEEMLAVARAKVPSGVGLKQARAEALPFKDEWFDAVVMTLVVHHLDRPRAFAELARVLAERGRLSIATFAPGQFERSYLNPFFPSIAVVDRERFGTPDQLVEQLRGHGFCDFTLAELHERSEVPRDFVLARIRGKHISTFQLIPEDEYEAGVAKAERELPDPVAVEGHWLVLTCRKGG